MLELDDDAIDMVWQGVEQSPAMMLQHSTMSMLSRLEWSYRMLRMLISSAGGHCQRRGIGTPVQHFMLELLFALVSEQG